MRRELEAAERETERLASLLNGLLALARERTRPPGRRRWPLGPELAAAAERWEGPAALKDQRIVVEQDPGVTVRAAREDLAIVIDNLIENAIEYSPPRAPRSRSRRGSAATQACIAVSDRGPGLPPG